MLTSRPCRPTFRRRHRRRRHTCMLQLISVRARKKSVICATGHAIPIGSISAFSSSAMWRASRSTPKSSRRATRKAFAIWDLRSSVFRSARRSAAVISRFRNARTRGPAATLPKAAFVTTGRSPFHSPSFQELSRRWCSEQKPDLGDKVGRSANEADDSSSQESAARSARSFRICFHRKRGAPPRSSKIFGRAAIKPDSL
jgi:hypothetical protein